MDRPYLENIERKIRKEIRTFNLISKNDTIYFIDDDSAKFALSLYMIKRIFSKLPLKLKIKKSKFVLGKKILNATKVVIPWNSEDEANYFLECIYRNSSMPYLGHYVLSRQKHIKPLISLTHEEVEKTAKMLRLKFKKTAQKNVLKTLVQDYPDLQSALLKSSRAFEKN